MSSHVGHLLLVRLYLHKTVRLSEKTTSRSAVVSALQPSMVGSSHEPDSTTAPSTSLRVQAASKHGVPAWSLHWLATHKYSRIFPRYSTLATRQTVTPHSFSPVFTPIALPSLFAPRPYVILLLLRATMPRYSLFYSATEEEAATSFPELCLQQIDAPHFSSDDAEQLDGLINGTLTTSSRARNDVNQPLFRPKRQAQSVEELLFLNSSGFSIVYETVHRDKVVHHDSTSEDSVGKWKTRSRTPSSDEPSPRKCCVPTPTLSVKAAASSDGSDDDMAHV